MRCHCMSLARAESGSGRAGRVGGGRRVRACDWAGSVCGGQWADELAGLAHGVEYYTGVEQHLERETGTHTESIKEKATL
jgi:hypothetical protein